MWLLPDIGRVTLSHAHVESNVFVNARRRLSNADVIAFVDAIGSLSTASPASSASLFELGGEMPHTLKYVIRLLDREARDWGGKRVQFTPAAV